MSRADQRTGRMGDRSYYWAKDLTAAPAVFSPGRGDFLAMVDVDQYVDIPAFLCDHFMPVILYTFQPSKVCQVTPEYSYTFDCENTVEYTVAGGARYVHQVWNYQNDNLKISKTFLGIPYKTVTYLVDKRSVDENHQLILLTPLVKWVGLGAWLAKFLDGASLERFKPVVGDFLYTKVSGVDGLNVSIGRVGEYIERTISASDDSYFAIVARNSKVGLQLPHVLGKLDNDRDAAVIYEFHKIQAAVSRSIIFIPPKHDPHVHSYQYDVNKYEAGAKPSLTSFMNPIVDGSFAPALTVGNEKQAVVGRILEVKNTSHLDKFLVRVANEFVDLVLGNHKHKLVPMELDDVWEKQDRPTQRQILKQAEFSYPQRKISSFIKRESYVRSQIPVLYQPLMVLIS